MHRVKHIIQPVLSQTNAPLYKRYFRFAKHGSGWFRSSMFVIAMMGVMFMDSVNQARTS